MKRIISLLLILTLVTCCSVAMAADFGVSADAFLEYSRIYISSMDFEAKEIDLTADRGLPCHCFVLTNTANDNRIFVYGETVEGIEIEQTTKLRDQLVTNGQELAWTTLVGLYSLWTANHILDEDLADKLADNLSSIANLASADIKELMSPLYDVLAYGKKQSSKVGTLCGYPAAFEIKMVDAASMKCVIHLYIAPDQSMINIYKAH